ncbi:RNA helicase [Popillia japonica]|uniref:RNA helicase n=1 Tax=Popillia japonica TaxID=7064 RepID=A0AAW1HFW6_POPJA
MDNEQQKEDADTVVVEISSDDDDDVTSAAVATVKQQTNKKNIIWKLTTDNTKEILKNTTAATVAKPTSSSSSPNTSWYSMTPTNRTWDSMAPIWLNDDENHITTPAVLSSSPSSPPPEEINIIEDEDDDDIIFISANFPTLSSGGWGGVSAGDGDDDNRRSRRTNGTTAPPTTTTVSAGRRPPANKKKQPQVPPNYAADAAAATGSCGGGGVTATAANIHMPPPPPPPQQQPRRANNLPPPPSPQVPRPGPTIPNDEQRPPQQTRNRPVTEFVITITFMLTNIIHRINTLRQDFLDIFNRENLISYCIALEHSTFKTAQHHTTTNTPSPQQQQSSQNNTTRRHRAPNTTPPTCIRPNLNPKFQRSKRTPTQHRPEHADTYRPPQFTNDRINNVSGAGGGYNVDEIMRNISDCFTSFDIQNLQSKSLAEEHYYHLHAFLEFREGQNLYEIREFIRAIYDTERIDVQNCRSKKSTIIYVSKEDVNLLTNIKENDLAFNFQIFKWATRASYYTVVDPFVVRNHNCYKFLEIYHTSFKLIESEIRHGGFRKFLKKTQCYDNWTKLVCKWWNRFCRSDEGGDLFRQDDDPMKKRVALYLYGPTNVGKTCFISKLIGLHNERYVYYPSQDARFFMEGYRENFHKIIVFEEFNLKTFDTSMLKRLCEGRTYSYPVKHAPAKLITFRGPIIFISNFHEILDPAFRSRLEIVYADVPFWTGRPAVLPRENGDEDNDDDYEMVAEVVDNAADDDGMMMMVDSVNDLTVGADDDEQQQHQQ